MGPGKMKKVQTEDAMHSMMRYVIMLMTAAVLLWSAVPSAAQAAPAAKPDLTIDKIYLNPSGHVVVDIRNAGPGLLPDKAWDASQAYTTCFVIMIGVQFADYAALWAADPDRTLRNPGGAITYTALYTYRSQRGCASGWIPRSRSRMSAGRTT